jgi:diguanylate cyclase (GGDEF)-like protein/PAS domain S-box-containing protein
MEKRPKAQLLALSCDQRGGVKRVLQNGFDLVHPESVGRSFLLMLAEDDRAKGQEFLNELRGAKPVVDQRLTILQGGKPVPLNFSGGQLNGEMLIVGALDNKDAVHFIMEQYIKMGQALAGAADGIPEKKPGRGGRKAGRAAAATSAAEALSQEKDLTRLGLELNRTTAMVNGILAASPNLIYIYDLASGEMVFSSQDLITLLGYSSRNLTRNRGDFIRSLIHEDDADRVSKHFERCAGLEDGEVLVMECRMKHADGEWRWISSRDTPYQRSLDGDVTEVVGVLEDVTDRRRVEDQLWHVSTHDSLTGLYNRMFFEEEMRRMERGRAFPVSVLMVDVDDLKTVNDRLGHEAGDSMLRRTGRILRGAFRGEDVVARIGGDEFAVVLPNTDEGNVQFIIRRLISAVDENNRSFPAAPLSLSIGSASAVSGQSVKEAFKRSEEQLLEQKMARRQAY